jgi:hypothetical protein
MKYFVVLIVASLSALISNADTTCHWKKDRGTYWVQYDSNLINPKTAQECFQSIKKPVVLLENFEDRNEFEGLVFISDKETSKYLDSCKTETVQGLNPDDDFDQNRAQYFVDDVEASGDWSGETTTNSEKWQNYFNSKIRIVCH